jgi:hypothetical protein
MGMNEWLVQLAGKVVAVFSQNDKIRFAVALQRYRQV